MSHAYATVNRCSALAGSAYTWSTAYAMTTAEKAAISDGRIDSRARSGSSAASSPITLVIDFGSAADVIGFALLNHNLATLTAPTVTIASDNNSGFSSPTTAKAASSFATPTLLGVTEKDSLLAFPSVGGGGERYWRLSFAFTGTATVRFGELFAIVAGGFVSLSRQQSYGHGRNNEYFTNEVTLGNGEVSSTYQGGPLATKRFGFKELSAAQFLEVETMWHATLGGSTNLLWAENYTSSATAADTAAERQCILGRMQKQRAWVENDFQLMDADGFELRSRAREVGA